MKPISFTISKNIIILALLTLLSSVIVFTQISYRRLETKIKTVIEQNKTDTIATISYVRLNNCDSLLEANKLLKKKVDYYFEYYRINKKYENNIHNFIKELRPNSFHVSDTLYQYDWDSGSQTPQYIIYCDTISGNCYMKIAQ